MKKKSMYSGDGHHVNADLDVFVIQLGPVTASVIQANHTSAVGQVEGVNFTMLATSMSLGCRIEVSQTHTHFLVLL